MHNYQVHRIVFPVPCSLLPVPCSIKTHNYVLNKIANRYKN
ncbi:hypothetical protein [Moorena sp. SIO1F2]|nr:hypothetical protein [Moorena sp. SIO1F2]